MITRCDGLEIDGYRIPAFELEEGDLLGIYIGNTIRASALKIELIKLLTGEKSSSNLKLNQKMQYVKQFSESKISGRIFPMTVQKFLKVNGKAGTEELEMIYEIDNYIKPQTKMRSLAGNPRKWLSLFTTLSISNEIIFDTSGQDPLGAEKTIDIVTEYSKKGTSAIFIDSHGEEREKFNKYIEIKRANRN